MLFWPYLKIVGEGAIQSVCKMETGVRITLKKSADITRFIRLCIEIKQRGKAPLRTTVAGILLKYAQKNEATFSETISNLREEGGLIIPMQPNKAISLELYSEEDRKNRHRIFQL